MGIEPTWLRMMTPICEKTALQACLGFVRYVLV